jgi:hypothetical protein
LHVDHPLPGSVDAVALAGELGRPVAAQHLLDHLEQETHSASGIIAVTGGDLIGDLVIDSDQIGKDRPEDLLIQALPVLLKFLMQRLDLAFLDLVIADLGVKRLLHGRQCAEDLIQQPDLLPGHAGIVRL